MARMGLSLHMPEKYRSRLRIGTCSWKYDSWKGLVYDPRKQYAAADYLTDYAKLFNTVEIDQWFWSLFPQGAKLPEVRTVQRYAQSVPDDFLFTVKVPNAITLTHYYAKQPAAMKEYANRPNPHFLDVDLLNRFLEILAPLHGKLGPLMFQFEYLNKQKMPSLAVFLDQLDAFFGQAPHGVAYAIETRNPNWLVAELFDFLRQRGLGFVLLEGYYMPPIAEVAARHNVRTAGFSVIRLHGPDRQGIEARTGGQWSEIAEPKDDGLRATAALISENTDVAIDTVVNVNNHYEGCAPLTIQRLLQRLTPLPA
ncbi:MAG: DUF72 domain-containing protein [Sedimentisphaerales bacterium]|nr:DUF72 domain-containing protein [Sedimentisphaerales bacterium]